MKVIEILVKKLRKLYYKVIKEFKMAVLILSSLVVREKIINSRITKIRKIKIL
jgi:hypothetical protein